MKRKNAYWLFFMLPLIPVMYGQAPEMVEYESRFKIDRLPVNSEASDFAPHLVGKKLYFVSNCERSASVVYKEKRSGAALSDIYSAEKKEDGRYTRPKLETELSGRVNEGAVAICKRRNERYITRSLTDENGSYLKIFVQKPVNGGWSAPVLLPFCKLKGNFCHAALSDDGNTMIFASDINKASSKMDLFIVTRSGEEWSTPAELNSMNSEADELFPFISGDSLFFASNRKGGAGGLDIYGTNWRKKEAACTPLPYPINSDADDFSFWTDSSFSTGYFASNRNKQTKDDIYEFSLIVPDFAQSKTIAAKTKFCYTFFDDSDLSGQDTAHLEYQWDFGDGHSMRGKSCRHCYSQPGNYLVKLNVIEKISGEVFYNQSTYEHTVEKPTALQINCSDSTMVTKETLIDHEGSNLKGYTISKAYWSFGDGKYACGTKVKHCYSREGTFKVELLLEAENQENGRRERFRTEKQIMVRKH